MGVQAAMSQRILSSTCHREPDSDISRAVERVSCGEKPVHYTSKLYLHNIHTNPEYTADPSLFLLRKQIPPELLESVAFRLVLLVHVGGGRRAESVQQSVSLGTYWTGSMCSLRRPSLDLLC